MTTHTPPVSEGEKPEDLHDDPNVALAPAPCATEKARYAQAFARVETENGYLSGKRAAQLLGKTGLPQEKLSRIWELSDQDSDGQLSLEEFCVAMHLVQCCKRGLPLPHKRKRDPAPEMPKNRSSDSSSGMRKTCPVVKSTRKEMKLPRSPKRRSRMASLLGEDQQLELAEESQGTAVRNSEQDKREGQQDDAKYAEIFAKMDTEGSGYISGKCAAGLLRRSGLPRETLSTIWALSDQDADGKLSLQEFCQAMHHVRCAKRGFPLPVPDPRPDRNKSESRNDSEDAGPAQTVQHEHSVTPVGAVREELSSSPRRRSKGTSALDDGQVSRSGSPGPAVSVDGLEYTYPGIGEDRTDRHAYQIAKASGHLETTSPADEGVELLKRIDAHEHYLRREGAPASVHPTTVYKSDVSLKHVSDVRTTEANIISGTSQDGTARHEGTTAKVQPKLCQLKSDDVDAICADGEGAINSLRDVQSWRVLVRGLERLSRKDLARRVPVVVPQPRRHTLPRAMHGDIAFEKDFLPGGGRRSSLLLTAYEPAAVVLRQRAGQRSVQEAELERVVATAIEKWGLKVFPAYFQGRGGLTNEETDAAMGNLTVAGLPLLDEDVEVIVHLLRKNYAFRTLDLSRCFLPDSHFAALAQALAWNGRVEQLCLRACTFTKVMTSALADVLMVNKRITSLDMRGCRGLEAEDIQELLRATNQSNLLLINGMELAALAAEGSTALDLTGWRLGYVESMVVAHCMQNRPDGLLRVDLKNNAISTKAFTALMVALRKQTQLRSLDLSCNEVDERSLYDMGELLQRNVKLTEINLASNHISCSEFEPYGFYLMRLLSSNNAVTVFNMEENNVTPKMMTIVAEKLAANRAVRRDMTFVDCLRLKYPRTAPKPVVADPSKLHLDNVDTFFMRQEGIPSVVTTVHTEQTTVWTTHGPKPGEPVDRFFVHRDDINEMVIQE